MNQKKFSLSEAILSFDKAKELEDFLDDLLTPQELKAIRERWLVCQILNEKSYSYREIHNDTGVSLTTIGRVARFLLQEKKQGYRKALKNLLKERGKKS